MDGLSHSTYDAGAEQKEMDERENLKLDFDSAQRKVSSETAVPVLLYLASLTREQLLTFLVYDEQLRIVKQRGKAEAIVRRDVKARSFQPLVESIRTVARVLTGLYDKLQHVPMCSAADGSKRAHGGDRGGREEIPVLRERSARARLPRTPALP